jgi:hypothetical protein
VLNRLVFSCADKMLWPNEISGFGGLNLLALSTTKARRILCLDSLYRVYVVAYVVASGILVP